MVSKIKQGNLVALTGMAGMKGLLLLMMMVGAWRYSQNMIFKKLSEVIITRSKWLVTSVIDLNLYKLLLNKWESELIKLSMTRMKVAQKYTREGWYLRLLYSLELETSMKSQWKDIRNFLKGFELLQTRRKSAVVPIVGKVLSILSRTVSERDAKIIRKLEEVEKDQRILAQVAQESLLILNVTRLVKNRASINWLIICEN